MFKRLFLLCFTVLFAIGISGIVNVSANHEILPYTIEGRSDGWKEAEIIGSPMGYSNGYGSQLHYYIQGGFDNTRIRHTVHVTNGTIANDLWGLSRKECGNSNGNCTCRFDDGGSKRKYTFTVKNISFTGSYIISETPSWGK